MFHYSKLFGPISKTLVFGGTLTYVTTNMIHVSVAAKADLIDTSFMMASPVTDLEVLTKNKDDMKTKMELLVMRIQVS